MVSKEIERHFNEAQKMANLRQQATPQPGFSTIEFVLIRLMNTGSFGIDH